MSTPSIPSDLTADERALVRRFDEAGQSHVFRFLADIDAEERSSLLAQAAEVDLKLVSTLAAEEAVVDAAEIEAAEVVRPDELPDDERRAAATAGDDLLARGAVAAVLVAGGQATRLGFPGPKGTYPIGPVSDRTLFGWFAGRLVSLARRHGRPVPLYVMTSAATHEATVAFFEARDHLGLDPETVTFFRQGMVPALDDDGRLILETRSRIFLNPNGHGGVFEGLAGAGGLADMAGRGVEEIFYFQVDNVLVRVADPLFLGLHALRGAQMSTKVVEKSGPEEKVGVVARRGGRLGVVEYSELSDELKSARDPAGRLAFGAGNIAIHAIRRDFAERVAASEDLPYHRARKAVPWVDNGGTTVTPDRANATKFERFVFDALPLATESVTLEVPREREFAPVKNATGEDSPETARRALTAMFRGWYEEAGLPIPALDASGLGLDLEIDPEFADGVEDLRSHLAGRGP